MSDGDVTTHVDAAAPSGPAPRQPRPALWLMVAVFGLGLAVAAVVRRGGGNGDESSQVVARINGTDITRDQFDTLARALEQEGSVAPGGAAAVLLDALIDQELLYQHGVALGLLAQDPVIRRRVVQLVIEQQDANVPEPSADDLAAFYAAHASQYTAPAEVRFEQLYLPLRGDETAVLAEAVDLRKQIRSYDDLVKLVRAWPHRLRMHDALAPLPQPRAVTLYGPTFARQLFASPVGTISGPYLSSLGAHLVWVLEHRDGYALSLEQVRAQVTRDWRQERRRTAVATLLRELRAAADLDVFLSPSGATAAAR